MSTALLKFQRAADAPPQQPLDACAFKDALSSLPEPLAICEDSAVLYANARFTELCGEVTIGMTEHNAKLLRPVPRRRSAT
jgi:hypothetical protein